MGDRIKDERFSRITKDPRFRQFKYNKNKIKIDKRFQGMFTKDSFKTKYKVDIRGRPTVSTTKEDLERYYAVSDSDSEEEDDSEAESDISKSTKESEEAEPSSEEEGDDEEGPVASTSGKLGFICYFCLFRQSNC